ncbi:MAG TPA: Asp-tRNA(Asn)/Glu-tRNA(Gln) amidotransferase GatCAB subunit C [Chloroflexi bacterium]|nr:Asp-tRNA(Asn)/Glu-tRNA(Gln) amidotransferase GatCAB subunit C [Chloroflexota bacterium]
MTIDRDEVDHVAALARLKLSDDERETLRVELGQIVTAFEALADVDTDDILPTAQVIPLVNVERDDVAIKSLPRDEVLRNAPRVEDGQIYVPPVLDETS